MENKSYYKILDYNDEYLDYLFKIHKENFETYFVTHYGKWNDNRQKKSFKKMMESGFYKMIEFNGEIIGAISFEEGTPPYSTADNKGKPSVLWYLNIDKRLHGQGLGSVILRDIIQSCKFKLELKVYKDNFPAQTFYRKHNLHFRPFESDDDFFTMDLYTSIYCRRNSGGATEKSPMIQHLIDTFNKTHNHENE